MHRITLGLGFALLVTACASKPPASTFPFEASAVTPAAMGEVVTTTGPNGNTQLTVEVKHLAPPDRVAPGARVYVVWATEVGSGAATQNLGALRVDDNLNGKLQTVTPLQSFDVLVTAEAVPTVDIPGMSVLKVRVTPQS